MTVAGLGPCDPVLRDPRPGSADLASSWDSGFGFWPSFAALFFLAIPPIVTNTYIGVKSVDADTVEAARGMGLNDRQILTTIELPLAAPLIIAGIRTAAVQSVATATLGGARRGRGSG